MSREEAPSYEERLVNLAEIESRQLTGIYALRHRRIDEDNNFWKADWNLPQDDLDAWQSSRGSSLLVMVDTGTDHPILTGTKEMIEEDYWVWVNDLVNDYFDLGFILSEDDFELIDQSIANGRLDPTLIKLFEPLFVPGKMPKLYNSYHDPEPIEVEPPYRTRRHDHQIKRGKWPRKK